VFFDFFKADSSTTFVQTTQKRSLISAYQRDIINNNDAKETVSFALHLARGGGEKRFEWRSKRRTTTKSNFIKQNGSKTTRAFNTFV
jgi:hypothetical protein